jgi:hypothetical protein
MKKSELRDAIKESFKSLEKKLEKGGKSKIAAEKIAGSIAAKKMHGAGSGPTAKQKARMKEVLSNKFNPEDKITMDVPLFIRALEFAREDAKTDLDLHDATEKAVAASENGKTLTMADYNSIFSSTEPINEDDWKQSDDESDMAHSQLLSIKSSAEELMNMIDKDEQLDAWVQAKLTKAQDYLESVNDYLKGEETESSNLNEIIKDVNTIAQKIYDELQSRDSYDSNDKWDLIKKYKLENNLTPEEVQEIEAIIFDLNADERYINEKHLTTAEKNKKEEIVKAMKKTFKGPKPAMYAIATSKAEKMAEIIAKKLKEGNLGHNETSSIHQEGNSWIVTYKNMNGTQEKVFKTEKEARDFFNKIK